MNGAGINWDIHPSPLREMVEDLFTKLGIRESGYTSHIHFMRDYGDLNKMEVYNNVLMINGQKVMQSRFRKL